MIWTPGEDDYLRREWETLTDRELGDAIGRSNDAVRIRRHVLGLVQLGGEKVPRSNGWRPPRGYSPEIVAWARENPLDREARAILAHMRDPAAAGMGR